jgi:hypothetical protein
MKKSCSRIIKLTTQTIPQMLSYELIIILHYEAKVLMCTSHFVTLSVKMLHASVLKFNMNITSTYEQVYFQLKLTFFYCDCVMMEN